MELLENVLAQLDYTFCPPNIKTKVSALIEQGLAFFRHYNPEFTVIDDPAAEALLIEYVRYALANARDDFPVNYRSELQKLSTKGRIHAYSKKERNDDIQ